MYYAITTTRDNRQRIIALEQEAEQYLALLVEAHTNPVSQQTFNYNDRSWLNAQQGLEQYLTQPLGKDRVITGIITDDMVEL
ncbi:hypothetical protein UFOVP180_42 [uncultured Caudovirales phage]|uniref:Uncharacterized protein n=1 Tax=uncultured Caudovirales phage TaxID=2100421 RepID=A0A6J7WDM3_9CAUD|nr:hypothetical protein UFOVP180_42 [uncultured Caudovirales phage]